MAFDPEAYLAEKSGGGFDPEEYLRGKAEKPLDLEASTGVRPRTATTWEEDATAGFDARDAKRAERQAKREIARPALPLSEEQKARLTPGELTEAFQLPSPFPKPQGAAPLPDDRGPGVFQKIPGSAGFTEPIEEVGLMAGNFVEGVTFAAAQNTSMAFMKLREFATEQLPKIPLIGQVTLDGLKKTPVVSDALKVYFTGVKETNDWAKSYTERTPEERMKKPRTAGDVLFTRRTERKEKIEKELGPWARAGVEVTEALQNYLEFMLVAKAVGATAMPGMAGGAKGSLAGTSMMAKYPKLAGAIEQSAGIFQNTARSWVAHLAKTPYGDEAEAAKGLGRMTLYYTSPIISNTLGQMFHIPPSMIPVVDTAVNLYYTSQFEDWQRMFKETPGVTPEEKAGNMLPKIIPGAIMDVVTALGTHGWDSYRAGKDPYNEFLKGFEVDLRKAAPKATDAEIKEAVKAVAESVEKEAKAGEVVRGGYEAILKAEAMREKGVERTDQEKIEEHLRDTGQLVEDGLTDKRAQLLGVLSGAASAKQGEAEKPVTEQPEAAKPADVAPEKPVEASERPVEAPKPAEAPVAQPGAEKPVSGVTERGEGKQAWEMTREDFLSWKRGQPVPVQARLEAQAGVAAMETGGKRALRAGPLLDTAIHRGFIAQALSEGKAIPPEVQAEYPDLFPKPAGNEPAKADADAKSMLERRGTARRGDIGVKIVEHPSGEGYAVETTVKGDRRYPTEPPMTLEEAREFAVGQLTSPRPSARTEAPASAPAAPSAEAPAAFPKARKRAGLPKAGAKRVAKAGLPKAGKTGEDVLRDRLDAMSDDDLSIAAEISGRGGELAREIMDDRKVKAAPKAGQGASGKKTRGSVDLEVSFQSADGARRTITWKDTAYGELSDEVKQTIDINLKRAYEEIDSKKVKYWTDIKSGKKKVVLETNKKGDEVTQSAYDREEAVKYFAHWVERPDLNYKRYNKAGEVLAKEITETAEREWNQKEKARLDAREKERMAEANRRASIERQDEETRGVKFSRAEVEVISTSGNPMTIKGLRYKHILVNNKGSDGSYIVTHIPSGGVIASYVTSSEAKTAARKFAELLPDKKVTAADINGLPRLAEIEAVVKDGYAEAAPAPPTRSAKLAAKLDKVAEGAEKRIKESLSGDTLGMGLPVRVFGDMVVYGTAKMAKGAVKFADWSAEMIREFGEKVEPYLKKVYDVSREALKRDWKSAEELLKAADEEYGPRLAKEPVTPATEERPEPVEMREALPNPELPKTDPLKLKALWAAKGRSKVPTEEFRRIVAKYTGQTSTKNLTGEQTAKILEHLEAFKPGDKVRVEREQLEMSLTGAQLKDELAKRVYDVALATGYIKTAKTAAGQKDNVKKLQALLAKANVNSIRELDNESAQRLIEIMAENRALVSAREAKAELDAKLRKLPGGLGEVAGKVLDQRLKITGKKAARGAAALEQHEADLALHLDRSFNDRLATPGIRLRSRARELFDTMPRFFNYLADATGLPTDIIGMEYLKAQHSMRYQLAQSMDMIKEEITDKKYTNREAAEAIALIENQPVRYGKTTIKPPENPSDRVKALQKTYTDLFKSNQKFQQWNAFHAWFHQIGEKGAFHADALMKQGPGWLNRLSETYIRDGEEAAQGMLWATDVGLRKNYFTHPIDPKPELGLPHKDVGVGAPKSRKGNITIDLAKDDPSKVAIDHISQTLERYYLMNNVKPKLNALLGELKEVLDEKSYRKASRYFKNHWRNVLRTDNELALLMRPMQMLLNARLMLPDKILMQALQPFGLGTGVRDYLGSAIKFWNRLTPEDKDYFCEHIDGTLQMSDYLGRGHKATAWMEKINLFGKADFVNRWSVYSTVLPHIKKVLKSYDEGKISGKAAYNRMFAGWNPTRGEQVEALRVFSEQGWEAAARHIAAMKVGKVNHLYDRALRSAVAQSPVGKLATDLAVYPLGVGARFMDAVRRGITAPTLGGKVRGFESLGTLAATMLMAEAIFEAITGREYDEDKRQYGPYHPLRWFFDLQRVPAGLSIPYESVDKIWRAMRSVQQGDVAGVAEMLDNLGKTFVPLFEVVNRVVELSTGNRNAGVFQEMVGARSRGGYQKMPGILKKAQYMMFRGEGERLPVLGMTKEMSTAYATDQMPQGASRVVDEIVRLKNTGKDWRELGVNFPGMMGFPGRKIEGYELTDDEYTSYIREMAYARIDAAYKTMNRSQYDGLTDYRKAKVMSKGMTDAMTRVRNTWKRAVRQTYGKFPK